MPEDPCIGEPLCYASCLDLSPGQDFMVATNHLADVHEEFGCEVAQEIAKNVTTSADVPVWAAQYRANPSATWYEIWESQRDNQS